jgi:cbb3-type cytochrome oxidase maturation protein
MDILYLLVPLSVLAMLGILGVFAWALHEGQFDDLEGVAAEILEAGDLPLDVHQVASATPREESCRSDINKNRSAP